MADEPCYLRLTLPQGEQLTGGDQMGQWAMNEFTPEKMADSLEKVYGLAGHQDRSSIDALRNDPEGAGGFTSVNVRRGVASNMKSLAKDLHAMNRQGPAYEMEFDPSDWFADGKKFYDFPSGRLYWLAASGALEKLGFQVEGTGL